MSTLLVELFTEELPPKALRRISDAFGKEFVASLAGQNFFDKDRDFSVFATPRRLAVQIQDVPAVAQQKTVTHKLMPAKVGFDDKKNPTAALIKKLDALGIPEDAVKDIAIVNDGKLDMLQIERQSEGASIVDGVQLALEHSISKLPIPKVMSYQVPVTFETVRFVRPVHGLVALHGSKVLPVSAFGVTSSDKTSGHRFLGNSEISIQSADDYEDTLKDAGKVIVDMNQRKQQIEEQLKAQAEKLGCVLFEDESLVEEVNALVEWPVVYAASFDEAFLAVPEECLILTMKTNQKYFPLFNKDGKLSKHFLIVSNMDLPDPINVIEGNEKVVRPRLADAQFFFETDKKVPLEEFAQKLQSVVYHNKLGTQHERVQRITRLSKVIATKINADASATERAAKLCKADLLSGMVGEFPELQGTMGRYYAIAQNESAEVAKAIENHYLPRFSGDKLPDDGVSISVALADRLDTLVGIFGIGLIPTGEKDPYALRRQALGILRILIDNQLPLDLHDLLSEAKNQFDSKLIDALDPEKLLGFVADRLRGDLRDRGFAYDQIEAAIAADIGRVDLLIPRIKAIQQFTKTEEYGTLINANKRIGNILKKTESFKPTDINPSELVSDEEKALFDEISRLKPIVDTFIGKREFEKALSSITSTAGVIDQFFENVMVMSEDPGEKQNRLSLLSQFSRLASQVADLSQLNA